jgi:hypothetical protein
MENNDILASKMFNFLKIQGMEISNFDKIIVNGENIFNKEITRLNGNKIDRINGFEYFTTVFFPKIFDIVEQVEGVNLEDISDETTKIEYCQKITKRIMGILILISNPEIASHFSTATTKAISIDNLFADPTKYNMLDEINIAGIAFSVELQIKQPETIDVEKKKKIAKAFGMSFNNIDNILSSNNIVIDITKSNCTLKSGVNYLIQTKLTGDNLKEQLISVTETEPEPEVETDLNDGKMTTMGIMMVKHNINFENNIFETTGQMRWIAYNSIYKLILKLLKDQYRFNG